MASDGRGEMASSHIRVRSQNERSHERTLTPYLHDININCGRLVL